MKNSIKISIIALSFCTFASLTKAQETSGTGVRKGIIYSVGAEAGISAGSFRDISKASVGGSLQADFQIMKDLYITGNAGYANFFRTGSAQSATKNTSDIQYIPVKIGVKYFPLNRFYVQGEAGAGFVLNRSDAGFDKSTAFVYAPQIGIQFPISGKNYIDAGVRYERSGDYNDTGADKKLNYFGLRVAYSFTL